MNDEATHTPATRGVQDTQASGSGERAGGTWRGRGGQRGAGGAGLETLQGSDPCWPSAVPVSRHPRIPRGPTAWCVRSRQKCMRFCSEVHRRVSECDSLYHEENGGRWPSPGVSPQTLCPQQGRAAGQRSSNGNPVRASKRARAARSSGSRPHVTPNADGWVKAADVPGPLQSQCTRTLEGEAILRDVETEPGRGFERQRMEAASALDAPWAPAGPVTA